jgi:hypothetical protein
MRKVLFAAMVSSIVLALAPAAALARGHHHHHRGHHRAHRTHARARDEHFGSRNDENPAPNNSAQNAGTVASFSNGVLILRLNDGSMVSGRVTNATEIRCEAAEPQEIEHSQHADGDHHGGSNGGDDNGDNNDNNDDQGEDEQAEPMCSSANLVPGAVVRDAELTISGAGAIWKDVELPEQNQ